MATHLAFCSEEVSWTEEPGGSRNRAQSWTVTEQLMARMEETLAGEGTYLFHLLQEVRMGQAGWVPTPPPSGSLRAHCLPQLASANKRQSCLIQKKKKSVSRKPWVQS